ncbi:Solute carrier family 25 member 39 [Wickerhamomyces ciferrii]|uniref:Solute carrier family 25 member 39 n=1 Tax=Wickerhamomyces ciferrii (strain ATCC 14091 / BCRC 22168 / CBS 111 / JCM 3599 / NBRC 0793 / NRRL Y-1031 F-60-10) TaxID=1206466 RepID=K0KWQ8_WICCF|nr:Solute carrier family 25 member 39 [Wickerhamomyces ciferrii]CCH46467.1 Solute carrier family 25 member 39 [Wickerhamomyces ciferrii]
MSLSSEIAGVIEESEDLRLFPSQNIKPKPQPQPQLQTPTTSTPPSTRDITLSERMISACSGSIITSLIVTPLDVVRVRLQQQEILLPSSNCCKRQVFWETATQAATQASTSSAGTTIPLQSRTGFNTLTNTKTNQNCITTDHICITDKKLSGTWNALYKIGKAEGPTTLYRGLSLTLLMAAPANIVYFTGYELLRDNSPLRSWEVLNPLLCGSIARVLAGTSVAPIELLKTRLQSMPSSSKTQSNALGQLLKSVNQEIQIKGIRRALFKGLELTLWRDVPFSGIYWASYEFFKNKLSTRVNFWKNDEYNLFLTSFLSGSISGTIAALATNPFDVGKTRLQISIENDGKNLSNKKANSMFTFMKNIWKIEGFGALYVGIVPRVLKIAPSCAIMISSYELGKRFFSKI